MASDTVMAALIAEAVGGRTAARRVAACLLLDQLQPDPSPDAFRDRLERIEARDLPKVSQELRALIAEHGLDAPEPATDREASARP